jgi:O-antigen/teichoic acid export membrane protein
MLVTNTVVMFSFVGLNQSVYYFYGNVADKRGFLVQTILLNIVLALAFLVLLRLASSHVLTLVNNPRLEQYFMYVYLIIFFQIPIRMREHIFWVAGYRTSSAVLSLAFSVLMFAVPICGIFFKNPLDTTLNLSLLGFAISFLVTMISYLIILPKVEGGGVSDGTKCKRVITQLRFSLPLGGTSYIHVVGKEMDKYFISNFFNPSQYAVYSRGAIEIPFISQLRYIVSDMMMQSFSETLKTLGGRSFLALWEKQILSLTKLNLFLATFLFAFADDLFLIVYTEKYAGSAGVFKIYLLTLLIGIASYDVIPRVCGKTKMVFYVSLLSLPLNFVTHYAGISLYGMYGPPIATIFCLVVISSSMLYYSARYVNVGFADIFPWKKLSLLLLASGACLCVLMAMIHCLKLYTSITMPMIFFIMLAYFYMYVMVLMAVVGLSEEEEYVLKKWAYPLTMPLFIFQRIMGYGLSKQKV